MGDVTAVDHHVTAGHERRAGRREEYYDFRDLFGRAEPTDRKVGEPAFAQARLAAHALLVELGLDRARADGVDEDAVLRELVGHRARELDETRLGDAVERA